MGAQAYRIIEDYVEFLYGSVVEIGSDRGEGSTLFLSKFCKENNLKFYSVDFEKEAYETACSTPFTITCNCTGEEFLKEFNDDKKICFTYLDNFDYIYDVLYKSPQGRQLIEKQKKVYKDYNVDLNNENSQLAHLIQSQHIEKLSTETSFILFDDTWMNKDGFFEGKGGTAIPFLINKGYTILRQNESNAEKWESFILVSRGK